MSLGRKVLPAVSIDYSIRQQQYSHGKKSHPSVYLQQMRVQQYALFHACLDSVRACFSVQYHHLPVGGGNIIHTPVFFLPFNSHQSFAMLCACLYVCLPTHVGEEYLNS